MPSTKLNLEYPESRLWLVRKMMCRQIEAVYMERRAIIINREINASPNVYTDNDQEKVIKPLASNQAIVRRLGLRDMAIGICHEMRWDNDEIHELLRKLFLEE